MKHLRKNLICQTELLLRSFMGAVPHTTATQGTLKLCSPSCLLDTAFPTFLISRLCRVMSSLEDGWEEHVGICLGPQPHSDAQGLQLCLADGFHQRWPGLSSQTLLTPKYCTERKLLVRESLGTEQSSPQPAIGIPIKGIIVKNNFYNNLLILQNVPATVWGFVLAVKSFMPVFSAVHHVFTAVAEKWLKTNGIPWKLNHTERREQAVGAGQHRPALKFCIFLHATHTAPENPSAAQQ